VVSTLLYLKLSHFLHFLNIKKWLFESLSCTRFVAQWLCPCHRLAATQPCSAVRYSDASAWSCLVACQSSCCWPSTGPRDLGTPLPATTAAGAATVTAAAYARPSPDDCRCPPGRPFSPALATTALINIIAADRTGLGRCCRRPTAWQKVVCTVISALWAADRKVVKKVDRSTTYMQSSWTGLTRVVALRVSQNCLDLSITEFFFTELMAAGKAAFIIRLWQILCNCCTTEPRQGHKKHLVVAFLFRPDEV